MIKISWKLYFVVCIFFFFLCLVFPLCLMDRIYLCFWGFFLILNIMISILSSNHQVKCKNKFSFCLTDFDQRKFSLMCYVIKINIINNMKSVWSHWRRQVRYNIYCCCAFHSLSHSISFSLTLLYFTQRTFITSKQKH